uniref:Uncharacterized protein n=1 Tax=Lepeophtheirus salmonis TaxID=72036 RepID=A0A0K2UNP7_LEPSM
MFELVSGTAWPPNGMKTPTSI